VLILQGYLEGKALQFWLTLAAEKKATFELAAEALKQRFPSCNDTLRVWTAKAKAISEMNTLTQGNLTSEQYVERANDLFAILGNVYSSVLSTKFVDGIVDRSTKISIDAQFDEAYRFPEVIQIYQKCTKSLRRTETVVQIPEESREHEKSETEIMRESVRQNQQMVSGGRVDKRNALSKAD